MEKTTNSMINRIQSSNIQAENKRKSGTDTSFKGAGTAVLSGLGWMKNNPALSACGVDMCSMVIPRTAVETKNRGKQSGIETFIREVSSSFIHAVMGLVGFGAATAISGKFNKANGVKAQNIFASGDTIKNMSEIWKSAEGKTPEFFEGFVKNIKGLNGTNWNGVTEGARGEIVDGLVNLASKTEELARAGAGDKAKLASEVKGMKSVLLAKITKNTGASASYKLAASGAQGASKEISANLGELVDSAVSLSNAFKTKSKEQFPKFVEGLMKNKAASTLLGLGICSAFCVSIQPINRMLTKKRTGNDGFVGVDSKEKDNSLKFKALKTAAGIGFPIFAMSTIGCKPQDLLANVQFNSKVPRINQFKFVYGLTIGSRLLSARDGNELREATIKDTLGFCTWLLFGDFVSKLATRAMGGKELINNPVAQEGGKKGFKYAKDWLMKSSVKSFDEILLPSAKEITKDGKMMKLKDLYKNAEPELKSQVAKVAGAQIAGYLFSGLALGIGIAKLNIFITKQINSRKKAAVNMNKEVNSPVQPQKLDTKYLTEMAQKSSSTFKEFN